MNVRVLALLLMAMAVPPTTDEPTASPGTAPASPGTAPASPGTAPASPGTAPARRAALPAAASGTPTGFWRLRPLGAPRRAYPVGLRTVPLARGPRRPLPTTVWYPAAGAVGATPRPGAPVHAGQFPLVLASHGLHGLPEGFTALAAGWAAAGFVVAAPAYPGTNRRSPRYQRADIVHQSTDAAYVIERIGLLGIDSDDPLGGHLQAGRVAAVGYSAGGFTTAGLFEHRHDPGLRAGVVIAGWAGPTAFGGPPARLLFIHGSADPVVPLAAGRAAYHRVPWPKAFLTLPGQRHGRFLRPGYPGYAATARTVTDFLRWTLYDDHAARSRLSSTAPPPPASTTPGPVAARLETAGRW